MAHAICGYPGKCNNLHGHSYELHVTVASPDTTDEYLPKPGFIMDFKELKRIVNEIVINKLDHNIVLSQDYIALHASITTAPNIYVWQHEPTAENILVYIKTNLQQMLPAGVQLVKLKLYETADSYAEWINTHHVVGNSNLKQAHVFESH